MQIYIYILLNIHRLKISENSEAKSSALPSYMVCNAGESENICSRDTSSRRLNSNHASRLSSTDLFQEDSIHNCSDAQRFAHLCFW